MDRYHPQEIESKWRQIWEKEKLYEVDLKKAPKPFYNLMMFPYPSAEGLHVGNMYAFTGADVYGRFQRRQGQDVFEPIGLDGFGIHSENFAIKIGEHPAQVAQKTQKHFYEQFHKIGNGFAWEHKLETYDPNYYRWTQWIFVQMFKRGLAFRQKADVNWCPSCKTVLADEQVINGACERCGSQVGRKELTQWFFRITKYADRLLENLTKINWSEKVKIAQRNWIGRSGGMTIIFQIPNLRPEPIRSELTAEDSRSRDSKSQIEVFTKFPETIFGVTYVVLAPEHPLVEAVTTEENRDGVAKYVRAARQKTEQQRKAEEKEKTGVVTGGYCLNPGNQKKVPIFVADYVLMGVGTGAVMGVPGHDTRDFLFAKEHNLPIIRVIGESVGDKRPIDSVDGVLEEGVLVNSAQFDGLLSKGEGKEKIDDWLEEKGWGKRTITYHLRDWLISRQRYWGPPVPMVYCEKCAQGGKSWFNSEEAKEIVSGISYLESGKEELGPKDQPPATPAAWSVGWYPVPEKDLPVKLPYLENFKPTGTGEAPLAQLKNWVQIACPGCGGKAKRETEVSDTFLDSAWYFLRYPSTRSARSGQVPFDPEITKKWLPVNMYIGGAEHSVLHLLYSRFLTMVFHDWGLLEFEEPFSRFFAHGLLIREGAKISKSKGNVIVPDEYIDRFGADTLRTYLMFLGPFDQGGDFRDTGIMGTFKFLNRVWTLVIKNIETGQISTKPDAELDSLPRRQLVHQTIREVTLDLSQLRYNTAIAKIRLYFNQIERYPAVGKLEIEVLLKLLAPLAPFITEELWHRLGNQSSIHQEPWPKFDLKLAQPDKDTIVVQVNGKLRGSFQVERGTDKEALIKLAKNQSQAAKYLQGKRVKKTVVVESKLVNFVI